MDYTKDYTIMCKQAKVIQRMREGTEPDPEFPILTRPRYKEGDIIFYHSWKDKTKECAIKRRKFLYDTPVFGIYNGMGHIWEDETMENINFWWLPRQDDLQKMVNSDEKENPCNLLKTLLAFIGESFCGDVAQFTSMEQLWLVFVMGKNYDLYWNGEDWERPIVVG